MPKVKDLELFGQPEIIERSQYQEIERILRRYGSVRIHLRSDPMEVLFIENESQANSARLDCRRNHRAEFLEQRSDRCSDIEDPSRLVITIYASEPGPGSIMLLQCHSYSSIRIPVEEMEREFIRLGFLERSHVRIIVDYAQDAETAYRLELPYPGSHPLSAIVEPYRPDDEQRLTSFWRDVPVEDPSILWYPSSALDMHAFDVFEMPAVIGRGIKAPDIDVYTCLGYPPADELIANANASTQTATSLLPYHPESVIPLRLNRRFIRKRIMNDYRFSRSETEDPSIPEGAAIVLASPDPNGRKHRLLYLKVSNLAFERQVVRRGLCNPTFYCSIRDGCSFGGNRRCEADIRHVRELFSTRMFSPRYWITDHIRLPTGSYWFGANHDHEGNDFSIEESSIEGHMMSDSGLITNPRLIRIE